jgi:hypothetical protein
MKLTIKTVGAALAAGIALLAGCANPLMEKQAAGGTDGRGVVTVRIGSAARTLRPDVAGFTKYEIAFDGPEGESYETEILEGETLATETSVELIPGVWTITVTAFTGAGDAAKRMAQGSAEVRVEVNTPASATVVLLPYAGEDAAQGTLSYTVTFPADVSGSLVVTTPDGTAIAGVNPVALTSGTPGTLSLAPGLYRLQIRLLDGDDQVAGKTEALHIYSGQTTTMPYYEFDGNNGGDQGGDNGGDQGGDESDDPNDGQTVDGWIIIASVGTFAKIGDASEMDFPLNGQYKQTRNITITNDDPWTPIGTIDSDTSNDFSGVFDGGDYKITAANLTFNSAFSFFGNTYNATLKNIHIKGSITTTGTNSYLSGIATFASDTTITNCSNAATLVSSDDAGGIVRALTGVSIVDKCINSGSITGVTNYVGGIAGLVIAPEDVVVIKNCSNSGSLHESNAISIGGIVGRASTLTSIIACKNIGTITGDTTETTFYLGGIVGDNGGKVTACYNTGNISSMVSTSSMNTAKFNLGGIVGYTTASTGNEIITACYSTGTISLPPITNNSEGTINPWAGGIIGRSGRSSTEPYTNAVVTACYWKSVTGDNNPTYGIGAARSSSDGLSTGTPTNVGTFIFGENSAWPSAGSGDGQSAEWGTGNGSDSGKYWKNLGSSPSTYPVLWWE